MIVGHGTLASVLTDHPDRVYFASGVPNSQETRETEYQREKDLLLQQDKTRRLVYFSTISIFFKDSRYTQHKLEMEKLIKENFPRYTIMRLGNVVWGNNPVHLLPFFRQKHDKGEPIEVQDVYRFPLELDEFLFWIDNIPGFNCEINVSSNRMKVIDLLKKYVYN